MAKKELTNAELEALYEKYRADKKFVKSLDAKTTVALANFIKKRGLKEKADQYACISWINWPEETMQRAYLLAANGYIARSIREYELDGGDAGKLAIIKEFFQTKLGFNADKHVTEGISKEETAEKIRADLGFATAEGPCTEVNLIAARDAIRSAKNTLKLASESTSKIQDLIVAATKAVGGLPPLVQKSKTTVAALSELSSILSSAEQREAVINRRIDELARDEARLSCAISENVTDDLLKMIPPQDNVHGFNRYVADNWGSIKEITRRVYEVPGYMDATLFFHGAAKTLEDAQKFMMKLRGQLPYGAAIFTDQGPTLIAPDLEDEQMKLRYIDKNDVFSKILDRAEADNKIVEKITQKKVVASRKKIIIDEFKKNPKKLEEVRKRRQAGEKVDVSGLNAYAKDAGGWVNGYTGPSVTIDDEQEIIDEIIYGDAVDVAPIAIMGMNSEGNFEKIDVAMDIPAEYTIEDTLAKRDIQ